MNHNFSVGDLVIVPGNVRFQNSPLDFEITKFHRRKKPAFCLVLDDSNKDYYLVQCENYNGSEWYVPKEDCYSIEPAEELCW